MVKTDVPREVCRRPERLLSREATARQERGYIIVNSIYYDISPLPWLSH